MFSPSLIVLKFFRENSKATVATALSTEFATKEMESLLSKEHAEELDKKDPLRHLRAEFIFPSKADLKSKTLNTACKYYRLDGWR